MSSLTAFFGSSDNKPQDSEKLVSLYWNRAELKKEFAEMRNEQFRLKDKIRRQEGATARLQQLLDHLEILLEDPQWAANVLVHYQLRGLASHCDRKLARFAEQLKQQREQKQHDSVLLDWKQDKSRELRELERRILNQREKLQIQETELQAEQDRYMAMSGLMRFFKRRSVRAAVSSIAEQIELSQQQAEALAHARVTVRDRKPPHHAGLDIPTKRSINFMILAFAQQLFLDFEEHDLATLAKEASEKSVGTIKYGDPQECDQFLHRIRKRLKDLEKSADYVGVLQERSKLIGAKAQFVDANEAVPIAGSVSTLFSIDMGGVVSERDANLLGENYWGISTVLSR